MELLWLLATGGVSLFGYWKTRQFVRTRLRFVDAVAKPGAPVVAGTVAALVAGPIAWALPVIGITTAVIFGAGVGLGVHHGSKDVRRLPGI